MSSMSPTRVTQGSGISRETTNPKHLSVQETKHEELEVIVGQLQEQLRGLQLERTAILRRIGMVKRVVVGLADLFGSDVVNNELQGLLSIQTALRPRSEPGLTNLCRQLLAEAAGPLSVRQIVRQLGEKSPASMARQRNPENSLRTILRRLVSYGEAEEVKTAGRSSAWRAPANAEPPEKGEAWLRSGNNVELDRREDVRS